MPVHYPLYNIGDRVEFDIILQDGDPVRTLTGEIVVIDAHGTYETCYADASYDVNVDGLGWFKHIAETKLRKVD